MRVLAVMLLPAAMALACSPGETTGTGTTDSSRAGAAPGSPSSREVEMGLREYGDGNFPEAAQWFRLAVQRHPEDSRAHYYLGYAYLQEDQNRAALEALDRAVSLEEGFLDARLARARVYIRIGDYSAAEAEFRRILEREPENLMALFNLGFILSRSGGYAEAIEVLEKVTRLRPDHPEAPYYLGLAALKSGDLETARSALQEAIRLDPDHPGAHFNLGQLLMRLGRREEAEEQLRIFKRLSDQVTALEHLQEQIQIRSVEAFQLQSDGDLDGAIRVTEEILRIAPENAPTWKDLAVLRLAQGRREEALAALLRATEVDPNFSAPYFHLANLYRQMGDAQKAAWAADRFRLLESGEGARRQEAGRW